MGKRKQYTVVADVTISLHQTVWATSKEQALRIAQGLHLWDFVDKACGGEECRP